MDEKKYSRYAFFVFFVSFLIRLFIASFYGLSGDEAHYFQYASNLSLSYFDHPGLAGYFIFPFLKIFGNTSFAVRLPALICSSLCMWLIYVMGRTFYSVSSGFWALVIFCLIPLFSVLGGTMTVPDTILCVFWLLSIYTVWKIYSTGRSGLWYLLGILVGLSLLTKYSGVLLYFAILIFLLIEPQMRKYLRKKQVYLGFIISLFIFCPVLIWNYNNHWASFVFQFGHGLGEKSFFDLEKFTQNIFSQMAVISVFFWIMMVIVFLKILKKLFSKTEDVIIKLFFSFSFPVFALFGYASLSNEVLPHWPAPGYLTLILPLSIFVLEFLNSPVRLKRIFAKVSLFTGAVFTLIIPVHIVFRCIPLPQEVDPTGDLYGWDKASYVAQYLLAESEPDAFLLTHKFYLASLMSFYLPDKISRNHLFCLSKRIDQYDFWQNRKDLQKELEGKDAIFFTDEHFKDSPEKFYKFKNVEKPLTLEIFYKNKKVKTFYFYKCENFKTYQTDSIYFNSLPFSERNLWKDLISLDNRAFLIVNRIAGENRAIANFLFGIGYLGSTEINVLLISLVLFFLRRKDFLKLLGIFMLSLIIGAIVVHLLKETSFHPRPVAYFKDISINTIGPVLKSGSFPSGHSQTAFTSAIFLSWLFPVFTFIFFIFAFLIAFSRVFAGVHFFRDILVGASIGMFSFWLVLKFRGYLFFIKKNLTRIFVKIKMYTIKKLFNKNNLRD